KVLAFLRKIDNEIVLVVVNLSRFAQSAEIDLREHAGCVPVEMFSRNPFPQIKKSAYTITLGPHTCYWFVLQPKIDTQRATKKRGVPTINAEPNLETLLRNGQRATLEKNVLPNYLPTCRWFGAKARTVREMRVVEHPALGSDGKRAEVWFVEVSYIEGPTETYALPVTIASGEAAKKISQSAPNAVIAKLNGDAILFDAIWDTNFREQLFGTIAHGQRTKGNNGELIGSPGKALIDNGAPAIATSHVLGAEQSNSSMLFENKYFLKLYRKLEDGVNPDVEVTRFLTDRVNYPNVPAFGGAIEYRRPKSEPTVICLLQNAVSSEADAWTLTLDHLGRYYERALARKADLQNETAPAGPLLEELIGGIYPEKAKLLGQRTGELHLALASAQDDRTFAPEPFNAMAQRSVFQSMRALLRRTTEMLERKIDNLPENFRAEAREVLDSEKEILAREKRILDRRTVASKIRIHGDYHLGQVLYTGKDFVILDFEGEPARPLSERKLKRSPLRDVAGMMRSFQYAAYSALWQPAMRAEDIPFLERWADVWYRNMSSVFLQSYLTTTAGAVFIPKNADDLQILLEAYLLDKAV